MRQELDKRKEALSGDEIHEGNNNGVHGGQLISKCLMIPLHCCSVIVNRLQQVHL